MSTQAPDRDRATAPAGSRPRGYYWERCRRTSLPFVVGALGLAGLGVGQLLPIRHRIESDLRVRSLDALDGAGLNGVNVDFTGQDGVLTGTVSSASDVDRALAIVRGLEGVRVATSRLSYPGAPGGPAATDGAVSPSATPSVPVSVSVPPSASAPASVPAGSSPTPSEAATSSPAAAPSPTPTVTATPSVAATPSAPTVTAVQQQLKALPPVAFAHGSTQLTPAGRATAAKAAAVLRAAPALKVAVNGYTDDVGDWDVNLAISKGRAEAVRQALIADGVAATRVTATGWSEERPKVPNTSPANRAVNRRVEIVPS